MTKRSFERTLAALMAGTWLLLPAAARAAEDLDHIKVSYHGGALIQHVQVATLFWGKEWEGAPLRDYLNGLFPALFDDGRYMANLGQYSVGGYAIGNGRMIATGTDDTPPPATVTDAQIQAEIRAQVAAGRLPAPGPDTLYVLFTPPDVVVVKANGEDSVHDFAGYHDFAWRGQFAYAVIPYETEDDGGPGLMTLAASHEMAEAVTNPLPQLERTWRGGWYDEVNGEIGDIPVSLLDAHRVGAQDVAELLVTAGGVRYLVQKVWSNRDGAPAAFAQNAAP